MKLLHIDSSPLGAGSVSRELSRQAVSAWTDRHAASVDYLDLASQPLSHLNLAPAGESDVAGRDRVADDQQAELFVAEALITQFLAADVVVIGAPMINFTVPSQLKAWIDRIAKAGRTFRYTESGVEGLVKDKTIVLVITRGGVYSSLPQAMLDHQEAYLRSVFTFLGVSDVRVVRAEGLALGAQHKEAALAGAWREIQTISAVRGQHVRGDAMAN